MSEPLALIGVRVPPRRSEPRVYDEAGRDKPALDGARYRDCLPSLPAPEDSGRTVAGSNSSIRGAPLAPEEARLCSWRSPCIAHDCPLGVLLRSGSESFTRAMMGMLTFRDKRLAPLSLRTLSPPNCAACGSGTGLGELVLTGLTGASCSRTSGCARTGKFILSGDRCVLPCDGCPPASVGSSVCFRRCETGGLLAPSCAILATSNYALLVSQARCFLLLVLFHCSLDPQPSLDYLNSMV